MAYRAWLEILRFKLVRRQKYGLEGLHAGVERKVWFEDTGKKVNSLLAPFGLRLRTLPDFVVSAFWTICSDFSEPIVRDHGQFSCNCMAVEIHSLLSLRGLYQPPFEKLSFTPEGKQEWIDDTHTHLRIHNLKKGVSENEAPGPVGAYTTTHNNTHTHTHKHKAANAQDEGWRN